MTYRDVQMMFVGGNFTLGLISALVVHSPWLSLISFSAAAIGIYTQLKQK